MTDDRPGLDDPEYAAFAWSRYRRILWWMALLAAGVTAASLGYLRWSLGFLPILMAVFVGAGIFLTIMMSAALMGLMFLSAGTGHDDQVIDPLHDEIELDD